MRILVCAPTLTGREKYLENMAIGYSERSTCDVVFSAPRDLPSCGEGWNVAAAEGLQLNRGIDFIHFSNDDVVPALGWDTPMISMVKQRGWLPACRMEPAEYRIGHTVDPLNPVMPPADPPEPDEHSYFYSDLPEKQPQHDGFVMPDYANGALPFMSVEQWRALRPFIPIHFGTDKWIYHVARGTGHQLLACMWSVMFNYAAPIGRSKGEWTEQDYLDFDLNIAYPMYVSGALTPYERHPLRNTHEGLRAARDWRARNVR